MARRPWLGPAAAFVASLVLTALLRLAGWAPLLNRDLWHLPDTNVLGELGLGEALTWLHAQPPGMTALTWLGLRAQAATGVAIEALGGGLYALLAASVAAALAWLLPACGAGRKATALTVALWLSSPATHLFQHFLFYELPVATLLTLLLVAALRLGARGRHRDLALVVGLLLACVWTRSLYHPLWALATFALILVLERALGGERPGAPRGVAALALVLGLAAWPTKNWLVFGGAFTSSWTGYNLTNGLPLDPDPALQAFFFDGTPTAEVADHLEALRAAHRGADLRLVAALDKTDGSGIRNWNHATFLVTDERLRAAGWRWRRQHPRTWLQVTAAQYGMACRAPFTHPYSHAARAPKDTIARAYAEAYRGLVYADLRPWIEAATPGWWIHDFARVQVGGPDQGRPVPYTLFGLVLLPLLALATLWRLSRTGGLPDAGDATAALAAWLLLWTLAVPCLTDGQEANRMRYDVAAVTFALVGLSVSRRSAAVAATR